MSPWLSFSRLSIRVIRRVFLWLGIACAVGSIVLGLVLSHRQSERQCYRELSNAVRLWANGCGFVFEAAETSLADFAKDLPGKPRTEIQAALRQAVFDHPIFREAGWIEDGQLVCTSFGLVDPPTLIPPEALVTSAEPAGLHFIPPTKTLLGGESLIINRKVNDRVIADVLISPNSLTMPLRQVTKGTGMAIYLLRADGVLLLRAEGAERLTEPPQQVPKAGLSRSAVGLTVCQEIRHGDVYAVAIMPDEIFYQHWREQLPIYGLSSIAAATIFLFGAWQMRQRLFGIRAEIREAIGLRQFQPYFQPVVNLADGTCEGAELLVRWIHPTKGLIPPNLFIPEAEAAGLLSELTLAMIARESAGIRQLLQDHPEIHLNLNLATVMLYDDAFVQRLAQALGDETLLRRFHFELTESASAGESARKRLAEFKAMGIRLAVDDFGTGYSNLRYLKEFPFDYLKIDKAFVDGIASATTSSGLIDSIVGIGQNCGLHLIAEGVEQAVQAEYLRNAGVQSGQGYYFSRPAPLEEFAAWLQKGPQPS